MDQIDKDKIEKYFFLSRKALELAEEASCKPELEKFRTEFLDTIHRYLSDAEHFHSKGDMVNAFAALNYAHGWLDAGAKIGLWIVNDDRFFAGVE